VRRPRLHSLTWLVWALSALVCVQLAPNPLSVVLVVGVAFLMVELHGNRSPLARAFPLLVALSLVFVAVKVVINGLTFHGGAGPVLFSLPQFMVPSWLGGYPVGGPVELVVVLQAAVEGFVVVGVVAVFGAFNATVSHYELVQSAPRAFHEPGLVVVVALAFVPSVVNAALAVREADRARTGGVVVRRGRLVRLAIPVLESGMEKALALAESMDSRGFGRGTAAASEKAAGWCGLGALGLLGAAFLALVGEARSVGLVLAAAAVIVLGCAVWLASRASRRSRYRPTRLGRTDFVVMAVVVCAPLLVAAIRLTGTAGITWTVSAPIQPPAFSPLVLAALACLAVPAFVPSAEHGWRVPDVGAARAAEEPS